MQRNSDSVDEAIDMERTLSLLTDKQREVIELMLQGYSQADIAEILRIHRNSVRRRLIRVQKVCKNKLTLAI